MTPTTDTFDDLDRPDWLGLFDNIQRSWFRLETLQVYSVEYERAEYDQFLATGRLQRPTTDWQLMMDRHRQAGRRLQRVHVVAEPLTDYLRYEIAAYRLNSQYGEDIRLIPTGEGSWPSDLSHGEDFWLLDDREVWNMHYDDQGRFLRATRSTAADHLARCRQWRDTALGRAVPLTDYLRTAA